MDYDNYSTKHIEGRELIDYLVEKTSSTTNAELLRKNRHGSKRHQHLASLKQVLDQF